MSPSGRSPHWFSRNADLIAATFIVIFAGIGTAASEWAAIAPQRMDRWVVEPAVKSVRPHINQFRTESRETVSQIHDDIRHDLFQAKDDIRHELFRAKKDAEGEVCQMRKDLHQAGREAQQDTVRFRDDMRRFRSEIRQELRSWFH